MKQHDSSGKDGSSSSIPAGWRKVALGEVIDRFYSGGTPATTNAAYWAGSIPWITGADIVDQEITQPRRRLTIEGINSGATEVVPAGGLLIVTRTGVGKVAVAPYEVAISQDITGAITKRHLASEEYLCWWLAGNAAQIKRLNQGTTITGVLRQDLEAVELHLPPLSEQESILAVLSAMRRAVDKTKESAEATELLRKALLEELLARGVPGWHSQWRQVDGIGSIPACWPVASLGSVAMIQTGRAVGKKTRARRCQVVPYLSVANVRDGHLDLNVVKKMEVTEDELPRFRLRIGDVLFTEGGDADKLGRGCVWQGELDPCLHQNHVFAVRPLDGILRSDFLALYAASSRGKAYFLKSAKQTSNLASINSAQLRAFPLPLPSMQEQETIAKILDAVLLPLDNLRALQLLRGAVAKALLSGHVRVPVFEQTTLTDQSPQMGSKWTPGNAE